MTLSNKAYNATKWTITVFLPAVGALYFALAQIWDFQRIVGVNATINAIITFGGLLIGYSTKKYNRTVGAPDGDLIITEVDGEKFPALGVNSSLEEMSAKDVVTLTVVDKTAEAPAPGVPVVNPATMHQNDEPPVQS